jgi:hypothetical protein
MGEAHTFAMSLRVLDKPAFARAPAAVRTARARSEDAKQALADHIERHWLLNTRLDPRLQNEPIHRVKMTVR